MLGEASSPSVGTPPVQSGSGQGAAAKVSGWQVALRFTASHAVGVADEMAFGGAQSATGLVSMSAPGRLFNQLGIELPQAPSLSNPYSEHDLAFQTGKGKVILASLAVPGGAALKGPVAAVRGARLAANNGTKLLGKANRIETHLKRLDPWEADDAMLTRIRGSATSETPLSKADKAFIRHESTESFLMDRGIGYAASHRIAGWTHGTYGNYDPSVIKQFSGQFGTPWKTYWKIE